jgi:hypothetical protein
LQATGLLLLRSDVQEAPSLPRFCCPDSGWTIRQLSVAEFWNDYGAEEFHAEHFYRKKSKRARRAPRIEAVDSSVMEVKSICLPEMTSSGVFPFLPANRGIESLQVPPVDLAGGRLE